MHSAGLAGALQVNLHRTQVDSATLDQSAQQGVFVPERNVKLRSLREGVPSQEAPGEPMSRAELAEAVNDYLWESTGRRYQLDGHTVARYERGAVRWPSAPYRSGLRHVLGASSDAELGFHPTRRGGTCQPMDMDMMPNVIPSSTSAAAVGSNPTAFLADTTVDTPAPAWISWTEVEHIRATTRAVAMSENLFGGGLSCEAALAQLRWTSQLLHTRSKPDVYSATAEAVGNLAGVVAYSAFDVANHTAADRCFIFALWCADQAGSWQLRANTLADMARKAIYLGELDNALSLIEFAQVRMDRLSATARAMLCTIRALLLALTGRHHDARDEVDRADAHFTQSDPGNDPPWLCYYSAAEHQGSTGKALLPLAYARSEPALAASRLRTAIDLQGSDYPRSRAFSRVRLASLFMSTGNPHEAIPLGHQAAQEAASMRSQRLLSELAALGSTTAHNVPTPETADLRHEINKITVSMP